MTSPNSLSDLSSLAQRRLGSLIGTLLDQADDALFDLASRALANSEQQDYLDAMRDARRRRSDVEAQFRAATATAFEAAASAPEQAVESADAAPALGMEGADLSLIAVDALEEQLAAERLDGVLERRHGQALRRWETGLGLLLGRQATDKENDPLDPLQIARRFSAAFSAVEMPISARLVILKLLERLLLNDFGGILDELNTWLKEHGIDVPIAAKPRVRRSQRARGDGAGSGAAGRSTARSDDSQADDDEDGDETASARDGESGSAGAEGSAGEPIDAMFMAMAGMFASYFGLQGNGHSQDGGGNAGGGGSGSSAVGKGGGGAGEPGGAWRGAAARSGVALIEARTAMDALNHMQREVPSGLLRAVNDRHVELSDLLKREVTNCVQQRKLSSASQLSPGIDQALTLVGMLFDLLLDQGHYSPAVRRQLVRVSVPYAKVALLDQHLFAHRTHPARRLLNALDEACDGNSGDTQSERELLLRVDVMIDRVMKEFGEDPSLFGELEARFAQVLKQHDRRVRLTERRTADTLRGKERLDDARLTASLELASLTSGHPAPEPVAMFLRRDWCHHLTMVLLREGEDSAAFADAKQIGVELFLALRACEKGAVVPVALAERLQPVCESTGRHHIDEVIEALNAVRGKTTASAKATAKPAAAKASTASSDPRLIELPAPDDAEPEEPDPSSPALVAAPGLELTSGDGSEQQQAPDPIPPRAAQPAERNFEIVTTAPVMNVQGEPEMPTGDIRLAIDATQVQPADIELVRAIKLGSWVDLIDADGEGQPAKLSWVSPISQRMLFVNRGGSRLCLLSPPEAAALITQGKMIPRAAEQAFDRAIVNVLDRMKSQASIAGERKT